ncbi:hypothetical protein PF005_g18913 [Phytophthora fragariae]|uniref:ZZ-type domain-containing protein n=1 Tax=Phytophthora fragariae TaxID=53985 RepID=A0A6A3WV43_9STRA|nr:hypothetical protein PF003_g23111 [Phytophthora fragariae]KAE8929686.1 hypothetical protein PF009_g20204 [Phytophthora fragariae]KAE9090052.1 hypothetical protein PF010_g18745 [Phytophthora fragariae]KAE9091128.1 hypothetical protein PF007_g18994 [Phytophthora fragariae]KAE9191278.1 hypothetical protein PF005_g18913 [Phytophthora fragariae]
MAASARTLSPKKRQWLGSASPPSSKSSRRAQHPRLVQCRASEGSAGETDNESLDLEDVDMDEPHPAASKTFPGDIQTLPDELLALALAQLDGRSLLACAATCRAFRSLTFDREVWKGLCVKQWPTLRTQLLPQLPGAPDYDLVRLYGGCWRRCFLEKHAKVQRAQISVKVPNFSDVDAMRNVDKVVSETFTIGEHRFCLWVFPNGNPNEAQYKGRVLSVYLVLTDLARRPPDWLTCAVFSLQVENGLDPRRRLEWHSCLTDNKFHKHLNNWGVHSLGSLATLRDPQQEQVENLAERLDIPKFRVRSAFRKCHEDATATLRYIMEGRHLGFICDSCGETDFTGARYNCAVCSDYDLCAACNVAKSCEISHRYANVEGKWQRVYNFKDHKTSHTMRKMLPVFYGYDRKPQWRRTSDEHCCNN